MKKLLVLVLTLVTVLALTGCGDKKEESNKNYIEFTLGPDGTTVQETILYEDILYEDIITENVISWDDVSTYWD